MKKQGRPKNPEKSVSVHLRIEPEIFEKLQWYAKIYGLEKAGKPNISAALKHIVKKSFS